MNKFALALTVVLSLVGTASAGPFTAMIDFGDSLSDVGNDYSTTLGTIPGSPGYDQGRFSNGQIWLEKLGPALGLPAVAASENGGNDFAYGGVTSGTGYTELLLPNVETQVTNWTTAHKASSTQLFTVLGGANDLLNYLAQTSTVTPVQAADNIAASVHALYNDGARNILVANLPDLGFTPRFVKTAAQPVATAVSVQFDTELASDLSTQLLSSPGLDIYNLNLFALIDSAELNPSQYGLTDVTDQAYTGDTSFSGKGTSVADPSGYLFWDSIHPTTTGHALIAAAALNVVVPEPACLAGLACAGAMLLRPRRK